MECPKIKLYYAIYILSVVFGICLLLELWAMLYYFTRAAHNNRKEREKKKLEISLFREWMAKKNLEKQEQKKHEQNDAKNSDCTTPEQILSQKQELDGMRTQAVKLLHGINNIPVDFQLSNILQIYFFWGVTPPPL